MPTIPKILFFALVIYVVKLKLNKVMSIMIWKFQLYNYLISFQGRKMKNNKAETKVSTKYRLIHVRLPAFYKLVDRISPLEICNRHLLRYRVTLACWLTYTSSNFSWNRFNQVEQTDVLRLSWSRSSWGTESQSSWISFQRRHKSSSKSGSWPSLL